MDSKNTLLMKLRDRRVIKKICKVYLKTNLIDEIQFDVLNIIHTCTKELKKKKKIIKQVLSNHLKRKVVE